MRDAPELAGRFLVQDTPEPNGHPGILFPEAYDIASHPEKRRVWHQGLSAFHLIVMAGSLVLLMALFVFYKNHLGRLVQAYLEV